MVTRRAECSCGQLSATCSGEPVRVSVCHCLSCKRRTGSAFSFNARFAEMDVSIGTGVVVHAARRRGRPRHLQLLPELRDHCPLSN